MNSRLLVAFLAATMCAIPLTSVHAQTCRTNADTAAYVKHKVGNYALATDSVGKAVRDSLRIDAVASASAITLVTKTATCSSANTAYRSALAGGDASTFSGKLYVIQVG